MSANSNSDIMTLEWEETIEIESNIRISLNKTFQTENDHSWHWLQRNHPLQALLKPTCISVHLQPVFLHGSISTGKLSFTFT